MTDRKGKEMLPIPPEQNRLVSFYMYVAAARSFTSVYDLITEIQTFNLDQAWPVGSPEYQAAADTLESLKRIVAVKQNVMEAKSRELLD